ncbi:hypothetical protein [Flavipsychrobacter stenotrophus]|uniref:hypothetical protein n=1 Tax=Flavipsychrobacter stenotrophus TaxID=2077091 RepID=UPI001F0C2C94|nr:hypothetical protein [Flavipsychrobacter stenotrophus]
MKNRKDMNPNGSCYSYYCSCRNGCDLCMLGMLLLRLMCDDLGMVLCIVPCSKITIIIENIKR